MLLLRRVALHRVSHLAPGRVAPRQLHGSSHVPWPPIPSVRDGALQGPCGHSGSPPDPAMTAWFTTARGDDLDDALERTAHPALTEFWRELVLIQPCMLGVGYLWPR
jgi:hypothetical protein